MVVARLFRPVLRPARRPLTSPVVPLALLTAAGVVLLAAGRPLAGVCAVAAVAGVALSGST
jgi:hypothetical protein